MNIFVLFGRNISTTAMENMTLLNTIMRKNIEFIGLRTSTYLFIETQKEYMQTFGNRFGVKTSTLNMVSSVNSTLHRAMLEWHPKFGGLNDKAKTEMYTICHHITHSMNTLITDNSLGRGRPATAVRIAKSCLMPHLDLGREDLRDKLQDIYNIFEKKADIERGLIRRAAARMAAQSGIQFKLSEEKLKEMSRTELSNLAKSLVKAAHNKADTPF